MNKLPIKLFNESLQYVANISAYESLVFERSNRGIGKFKLEVEYGAPYVEEIKKDFFIEVDGRNDVIGIVEYKEYVEDKDGNGKFIIQGVEAKGILARRLIYPTAGFSHNVENDVASVVMQNYVNESAGSAASVSRRFPFLVIDSLNQGARIRRQARYKNLAEELEEISIATSSGWRMYRNGDKLHFSHHEGVDRTSRQNVNPSVIFSDQFDNLEETNYIEDYSSYKNAAIVAGEGMGASRIIFEEIPTAATGLDRREYFIDARDIQTENVPVGQVETIMRARAREKLKEVAPIQTFESGVIAGNFGAFRYLTDYDLGDFVTTANLKAGLTADAQINVIVESYTNEGFKIDVEIGEPIRGVERIIDIRTSRLNGELFR